MSDVLYLDDNGLKHLVHQNKVPGEYDIIPMPKIQKINRKLEDAIDNLDMLTDAGRIQIECQWALWRLTGEALDPYGVLARD